jgi:hypothetical protein
MLYLGHFSFERLQCRRRSAEAWHGGVMKLPDLPQEIRDALTKALAGIGCRK